MNKHKMIMKEGVAKAVLFRRQGGVRSRAHLEGSLGSPTEVGGKAGKWVLRVRACKSSHLIASVFSGSEVSI